MVVIHDENMNGKLDANALGIPKEGCFAAYNATSFRGIIFTGHFRLRMWKK